MISDSIVGQALRLPSLSFVNPCHPWSKSLVVNMKIAVVGLGYIGLTGGDAVCACGSSSDRVGIEAS